ncbi:MAG: RecQ family ATP-dependent DNA helicase [Phycisphaerae bacterium]
MDAPSELQPPDDAAASPLDEAVVDALRRHWGFDSLRPMQAQAVNAGLERRDSLLVMPTGGGKSLCFQLPPLLHGRLTVVVSPLIALMKDQVDGLVLNEYPAACLHGGMEAEESNAVLRRMAAGELALLYLAPERLLQPWMLAKLAACNQRHGPWAFAIDEAHCISQWGHDFRPEYRRLSELREAFPQAAFHAFTATATPRVQSDIVAQLKLRSPEVIIGGFDRPNLTYRIVPKEDTTEQAAEIIKRHDDGATIIYTISRRGAEDLANALKRKRIKAEAYHAGLDAEERRRVQESFASEQTDVVVATVAFGMGIDRSNVRCVIHAELPKSIEHYQQETGRAGRDGLPSECVLLYSGADAAKWKQVMQRGAEEQGTPAEELRRQFRFIDEVQRYATAGRCRHEFLASYFGQRYVPPGGVAGGSCNACDVCLGELETLADSTVVARKILACVARLAQHTPDLSFGAVHIVDVLRGSEKKQVLERGHDTVSTYGLLRSMSATTLTSCVNQLVDMGYLRRSEGMYSTLMLAGKAWDVMRGGVEVAFATPKEPAARVAEETTHHAGCFEMLRRLRTEAAREQGVAAYLIFSDASLQAMARMRPTRSDVFASIPGVGERKIQQFGERFCQAIAAYASQVGLSTNVGGGRPTAARPAAGAAPAKRREPVRGRKGDSFAMLARGMNVEDVAKAAGLTVGTVWDHLAEYVKQERPESIAPWVDQHAIREVLVAAESAQGGFLKPIYDRLEGRVGYGQIRVILTHHRAHAKE